MTGILTQMYNPDMDSLFLTDYPITKLKLEEILSFVRRGENVTSLWMPHSARTDFAIKLASQDHKNIKFFILDLSLSPEYLQKKYDELKPKVMGWISKGNQATLILDNFSLDNVDWLKYIFSLRHEVLIGKLTFLILAFESEFHSKHTQKTDMSLIYHNIIQVPYFTKTETFAWLENKTKDKEKVWEFCGGTVGLLINYLRTEGNLNKLHYTLEHVWGRFSERERHLLKSIAMTGKVPPYTLELKYMKEHNLIDKNNKVIGNWIKQVVGDSVEVTISQTPNGLVWDGISLDELFTDKEKEVFKKMLVENDLSRDAVADILWGKQALDKYSDWAIDQLFSRLRKKLDSVGIGGDKIQTLKGKGFKLQRTNFVAN